MEDCDVAKKVSKSHRSDRSDGFKDQLDGEGLPEAVPGLALVGVVQILPPQHQLPLHKPCVEPEIERTLLVVLRHVPRRGLEEQPRVALQHWTVLQSNAQNVRHGIVLCATIEAGGTEAGAEDRVAATLVNMHGEVGAVPGAHIHHAGDDNLPDAQLRLRRQLSPLSLDLLVVADVAALAGRLNALKLLADICVGPPVAKIVQAVGGAEDTRLNEPDTDHGAGATLAALAVHHDHIVGMLAQPGAHRIRKLQHLLDGGHVVVVDENSLHPIVEVRRVVRLLAAKVVDAVPLAVLRVEEMRHLVDGVAVGGPEPRAGEAGGNDPVRDVGEVKVEAVLLVAPLVL